ncbi:hypothetical protein B0H14DRAFT_3011688 [Mycena olivaceomarginata]|nr:hypothetical protein B0H14DRAFT_3011688 [Mycena olivaceomarginata]
MSSFFMPVPVYWLACCLRMGSRSAAVNWRPDREGKLCCSQGAYFIAPFSATARKSRGIPVCSVGPAVTPPNTRRSASIMVWAASGVLGCSNSLPSLRRL